MTSAPIPPDRPSEDAAAEARRREIGADLARTVLEAAARRLSDSIAEYEAALDRRVTLTELQYLDREVAAAERAREVAELEFAASRSAHGTTG